MDPSAIQAHVVLAGRPFVSWLLAGITGAGTITLAGVGIAQHLRERTPHLLLTGARAVLDGKPADYRVELTNLSLHNLWIDGVYAEEWTEDDGRISFGTPKREDRYTNHRTPIAPGRWVTLAEGQVFPPGEGEQAGDQERETIIAAVFYYAPTGAKLHKRAWRVRAGVRVLETKEIAAPPWVEERWRGG